MTDHTGIPSPRLVGGGGGFYHVFFPLQFIIFPLHSNGGFPPHAQCLPPGRKKAKRKGGGGGGKGGGRGGGVGGRGRGEGGRT